MRLNALGYLGINSPRAAEWLEFGPEVLGFAAEESVGGAVHLALDDRHHRVAIHPAEADACGYYGWELPGRSSYERAVDELKHVGVDLTDATDAELADRHVRGMVWLTDGDGFRHELFYGQEEDPKAFRPARGLAGYATGDLGLGHIAMAVSDLDRARSFFIDVLGFSLTDEIDAHLPLLFFHLSRRHHSLALGGSPGRAGLLHLGLSVRDLDDLGLMHDACIARDVPIRRTIGRHVNDRVVSFYLGTPSGFDVEIGCGSIEIEPGAHTATVFKKTSIWGHEQLTASALLPPATLPSDAG